MSIKDESIFLPGKGDDGTPSFLNQMYSHYETFYEKYNPEDFIYDMTTSTLSIPIIHQVWIGPKITEPALILIKSLKGKINNPLMYWVDYEITPYEERDKVIASNKNVIMMDIRKSHFFPLTCHFYDTLLKDKLYNFIKEIFSLAIIYQYGGYYFDTTIKIYNDFEGTKTMMPQQFFMLSSIYTPDVYFYYSPIRCKLTSYLVTFMINLYNYVVAKNIPKTYPEFMKSEIVMDYTDESYVNKYLKAISFKIFKNGLPDPFFMAFITSFLPILWMYRPEDKIYNIKSPPYLEDKTYENIEHPSRIHMGFNIGNGITIIKYFNLTQWRQNLN